jgi:hypothetical protein
MFNPNNISKTEQHFIRTYVAAMKRDYHLLWSVLDLMSPANLGVKEVVPAARLARQLQQFQADFDGELLALQQKHRLKHKSLSPPEPTTEDLAELFTLSFFKVVTTTPKGMAHTIQSIDVNKLPKIIGSYIATLIKLFKPFDAGADMTDAPVNPYWQLPFGAKNNSKQYDEEEYFDDSEDDDETEYEDDED